MRMHDSWIRCEIKIPPIFKSVICSKIAKFFDRQYFQVYGSHYLYVYLPPPPPHHVLLLLLFLLYLLLRLLLLIFFLLLIYSSSSPTYCRLYAMFMMYGCVREELQAMKEGLIDVIPPELMSGLTAEVSWSIH